MPSNKPSNFNPPGRIKYVKGDVNIPESAGLRYILVLCNDKGTMEKHASSTVSRWPATESSYRSWYRSSFGKMKEWKGQIKTSQVQSDTIIVHMLAVLDEKLDKKAFSACLDAAGREVAYNNGNIHIAKISEDWEELEKIITEQLLKRGMNVTVYE